MTKNPMEDVTPDDLFENARHEMEKYNQELRARAKTKEELTVVLEGVVTQPHYHQHSVSFTPHSEIVLGGTSRSYGGGHANSVELLVESNSPVQKLKFNGWPSLEVGDKIRAYILRGQEEYEKSFRVDLHHNPPSHWVERDYQAVEHPTKVEKLRDGKVVATYYNQQVKTY